IDKRMEDLGYALTTSKQKYHEAVLYADLNWLVKAGKIYSRGERPDKVFYLGSGHSKVEKKPVTTDMMPSSPISGLTHDEIQPSIQEEHGAVVQKVVVDLTLRINVEIGGVKLL
ncbi:MAG TPA: hypothetical protein VMW36_03225, partial [Patescibacteria group bacterium]|nr:hypothetical protein [Patescibacteria group bacterium]